MLTLLPLVACAPPSTLGGYTVVAEDGALTLTDSRGTVLVDGLRFSVGEGDESLEMQSGSYRQVDGGTTWTSVSAGRPYGRDPVLTVPLLDDGGAEIARVQLSLLGPDVLRVDLAGGGNRLRWDAPCTGDDAFVGLGSHVDVDHVGEAFPLWVSEPGVGKVDSDVQPDDWYLTGTRHATSFPDPFLLRPEPMGLAIGGTSRIEVDLCTDDRWTVDVWSGATSFLVFSGPSPLDIVEAHALVSGVPILPPDWAFAPWNDAVGGSARVREVAATLRAAGAPSSVIWTEDWKGGEETSFGYHLTAEWTLDETLYPDASAIDAELEDAGFKWLAYFSPFVAESSAAWAEAEEYVIQTDAGEPYLFLGITFDPTSVLDLSRDDARAWAERKMTDALALGFDGWMTDFGEWLPPDAALESADAVDHHNAYPGWWQATNAGATAGLDAVTFSRSGWTGTSTLSPITWAGDQRTSFDTDDGFPTVVPLGIGAGLAGVPMYGHDIGGYNSIGNAPSTKDLWFRWCTLGAFTPVMRTHHGAFKDDNWQFDSDAETLAHYARWGEIHTALFPYLRGLAAQATEGGTPLVLAPFLLYPDEPWGRSDAWLLGPSLFVAPVMEEGATGRDVALPAGTIWYDWWTGAPAESGWVDVAVEDLAVFAPAGAVLPLFAVAPDTLVTGSIDGLTTLDDADTARTIRVFAGAAGGFTEADGTTYTTDGVADASGTTTSTFTAGTLSAGGLTLTIDGTVERAYTLQVYR
ncbi:MAG: glycoside hydrolase family 31 protein [Pseudomonadota bacterium]|nr:glycoside hydrolase family 31 protein [Pseudomonadota bacterium]